MNIKNVLVLVLATVISCQLFADDITDKDKGLQLCKDQIDQQFKGTERVRLRDKYFAQESETRQQRTYYLSGRHWNRGHWYNDRVLCVTDISGSRVLDLEKAIGKWFIRTVPVQMVAGEN
jgi:hypothetical protein